MNVLVVNLILYTPENGVIPENESIKDTMIHAMCRGFVKNGHKVTLIASEEYKPVKNEEYDFDIVFFKSRFKKLFKPSLVPFPAGLRQYLREHADEFDFIVSSECQSVASFIIASVCPEKLIIWQELKDYNRMLHRIPSRLWYNLVCPVAYRKITGVAARSEAARKFISKYVKRVFPVVLDHGVDGDKFVERLDKKNWLITSSQLVKRKHVDYIIRQFAKFVADSRYADYRLLIAGRGEEEQNLRNLARELGIASKVDFLGFITQKELNSRVGASKLFMIATRSDLNMVSVPESIVSATPLVMNTVPATAKFVRENKLGVVNDNWTNVDLAEVVDNNEMYVANCHNMRPYLLNTAIAKQFVEVFEAATGRK